VSPTDPRPTILFLCTHNAGRSQMAAAFARRFAGERLEVRSGGSIPAAAVHPVVMEAMAEIGINLGREVPRSWTDADLRAADVIVTMGCGDACPVLPAKRYLDWSVPDPSGLQLEQVRPVRDEIERRVRHLVAELVD
jgi:arsenate reductase